MGSSNRLLRPALPLFWLFALLVAGLPGCSTTYVGYPGEVGPERSAEVPNCDVDDTLPGCGMERPMCQEANEYLCDPL